MKNISFLSFLIFLSFFQLNAQIIINNTAPYDSPIYLVDSVLVLDGVVSTAHSYQGDSSQIGFFNAINTSLGIDSGIVLCTGDVYELDPDTILGFGVVQNTVTDADLLTVANSVPGMIGQSFMVSSINNVAILEFDFIAISESFSFRYVFGSEEYFAFENTQYNDVFGFFLSGPGIAGPWSNGAINLAVVPGTNPPLPITISSVNSVTPINQQYFVPNQGFGLDTIAIADGYTTVLTTNPIQIQCGETYHIKLAIADGSDQGLSSFVWIESGSFDAPPPPPPEIKCIWETNDSIYFDWEHPVGASSTTDYYIMGSSTLGGNYTFLASVDYPTNLFPLSVNSIPQNIEYFYVKIPSSCADGVISSDTLTSVLFNTNAYNVSCWDDNDGKIVVDMLTNNIVPFTYILDGVPNLLPYPVDSVFSGLGIGTYTLTITDSASCYINNDITITAPNSPLQALTTGDAGLCHSDSLSEVVVYAVGGTVPYSYLWYNSSGGSPSSVISSTDTASGLSSGIYFAVVTDANGCDTTSSVQVLSANTSLFSTTQISEVVCKGDSSGYLIADAGGGFAPYTYTWSTSVGGIIKTTSGVYTTDTLHNIPNDIYLLDITDHFGCKVSQMSLTVNEPSQALVLDTIYLIDSIACFGDNDGRALGVKSGGDPSYVYLWDNGESTLLANHLTSGYHTLSVTDERGCAVLDSIYIPESSEIISTLVIEESIACYSLPNQISSNGVVSVSTVGGYPLYLYSWSNNQPLDTGIVDTAFALSYGVYALTTEDSLGCSVVDSVYLSEPGLLTMEAQELSWISCNGISDGLAFSAAYGGTLPYTFVWDNNQIGDTVNTLSEGLHTVIVTDARGCFASDTVLIHEPPLLTVGISVLDSVYCNGVSTGSLQANVLGGTPFVSTSSLYTYLWDDALQASQITAIATNLSADVYTVVVTDFRGCTATDTADITSVTNTMNVSATSTNVSCYDSVDGSASVVALWGYTPYDYDWDGPNGYDSSDKDIFNLPAGTYSVSVKDADNCIRNTSVDILEPLPIVYNISTSTNETCVGACDGLIYIDSLLGGTSPYFALLTNNLTGLVAPPYSVQLDNILGVCSGDYTVMLTDANECSSSVLSSGNNQAVINSTDTLPTPSISLLNSILCFGASTGKLGVSVVDPNYTYIWESISDPLFTSSSDTSSNLLAGDYVVTVQYTDSLGQLLSGCNLSDTLILVDGNEIFIGLISTNVLCYGDNTGAISITPSAGLSPYTYSWIGPNGYTSIAQNIFNLAAGIYSVIVTDANACEQSKSITISESPELIVEISKDLLNNYVLEVDTNSMGGVSPYSFSWRKDSQPAPIPNTGITYNVYAAGTYDLLVTDAYGCIVPSNNSISYVTPPSWDCVNNACIDPGTGAGGYVTQAACDAVCGVSAIDETSTIALSIYPNPFKGETTVDFGTEIKQANIKVLDVFGKLIEEYSVVNTDKHILKRENKASGIYFVEIEVESLFIKEKLIIE